MVYTYTSTRADYDPAKLLLDCPPSGQAAAEPGSRSLCRSLRLEGSDPNGKAAS